MLFQFPLSVSLLLAGGALLPRRAASLDLATKCVHSLEEAYLNDCQAHQTPHGYYGAFLQPCTFSFRQVTDSAGVNDRDACSDEWSEEVSRPVPMHWFFNLTTRMEKDDWDDMSSDDFREIADNLMLWPDQCVGAVPRCYSVQDPAIQQSLSRLFEHEVIPLDATHVQVDCRGDAVELSRVVYALADGLEKSLPTILAWIITVVLLSLVAMFWCVYACVRLCNAPRRYPMYERQVVPPTKMDYTKLDEESELLMKPSHKLEIE